MCVALVVVIIMSVLVIPKFAAMFEEMGSELPAITKAVVALSDVFIYKRYVLIIAAAGLFFGIKFYAGTESGRVVFGNFAVKAPLIGRLNVKSYSAKFARTLSTLISSGLGISQAIEITARSMTNVLYSTALEKARVEVEQGIALSVPIRKASVFPPMVVVMIHSLSFQLLPVLQ